MTRQAIVETAKRLFEERGFSQVTVAEISDSANVSVKTLFTYFDSKDDLLFEDEKKLCHSILEGIRNRKSGESPFDATKIILWNLIHSINPEAILESLEGFHKCMETPELSSRLLSLWEKYEKELATLLTEETESDPTDPLPKIVAVQLISIFRLLGSSELKAYLEPIPPAMRQRALEKWLGRSLELIGGGIKNFALKQKEI